MAESKGVWQFCKAQMSALAASLTDYGVTAAVSLLGGSVALSALLGAMCGGVLNCTMNYRWTFAGTSQRKRDIALRYFLVWGGSMALNVWGTVFLAELLKDHLPADVAAVVIARVCVSLIVAILWNYTLQKYYVFKD